jgi:hypothetical protein
MARDKEKQKATNAAYYTANTEKIKADTAAYYAANKERILAYKRFKKIGVTQEQYDGAYLKQKGVCAVCSLPCAQGISLAADHCHTTGVFRGLLCTQCNTGLGLFKDNKLLLENAIQYLKDSNDTKNV